MHQVGLSRIAYLSFVMFQGEFVGFLDQGLVVVGPVGADFAQEVAKPCNRQNIGRDVLAQSRHVRLYVSSRSTSLMRVFEIADDVLQLTAKFACRSGHARTDQRRFRIDWTGPDSRPDFGWSRAGRSGPTSARR